jgi:hypothetical protein
LERKSRGWPRPPQSDAVTVLYTVTVAGAEEAGAGVADAAPADADGDEAAAPGQNVISRSASVSSHCTCTWLSVGTKNALLHAGVAHAVPRPAHVPDVYENAICASIISVCGATQGGGGTHRDVERVRRDERDVRG